MYSVASAYTYTSSSPPSSPAPDIDSSPASSPGPESLYLQSDDDIPPISLTHPFAASAGAKWRPPQYERKRTISPTTPPPTVKKARYTEPAWHAEASPTDTSFQSPTRLSKECTWEQIEVDIWKEAGTNVIDQGDGVVDLDDKNLTHIPESFINDLTHFYALSHKSELINATLQPCISPSIRQLSRVATAPASNQEVGPRLLQRTYSAAAAPLGLPRDKLQLFLSSNEISVLPLSLLNLQHLTVLSLRNNNIADIPPGIVGLKSLQDLNIAQNKIQYLPAEMLQMSLKSLQVHPNRFIDQSSSCNHGSARSSTFSRTQLLQRRLVSSTKHTLPRIPPLVEILLRTLLSPSSPSLSGEKTVLETYYDLPLAEEPAVPSNLPSSPTQRKIHFSHELPPHIRQILRICLPHSVYAEEEDSAASTSDSSTVEGIGLCPSPRHQRLGTSRVFVCHAEERFSWEMAVAGQDVGGLVPIRWRGCQWGCLDFLDPPQEERLPAPTAPDIDLSDVGASVAEDGQDMEGVVQVLRLDASGPGGLDNFDD